MANKLIVIFGASGSGKSTLSNEIVNFFGEDSVLVISQDDYYYGISNTAIYNFDEPSALDFQLLEVNLKKLINNKTIKSPIYEFTTHSREKEVNTLKAKKIIILDGTMIMSSSVIRMLASYSIYCDIDMDICFIRRLQRDIAERGRDMDGIVKQYLQDVRPAFFKYIDKYKSSATFKYNEQNIAELFNDLKKII